MRVPYVAYSPSSPHISNYLSIIAFPSYIYLYLFLKAHDFHVSNSQKELVHLPHYVRRIKLYIGKYHSAYPFTDIRVFIHIFKNNGTKMWYDINDNERLMIVYRHSY